MTYEEAIKAIQVDGVVHATEESVSIEMSHSKMIEFSTALRVAEEALEKQIPKKPKEDKLTIPESYEENMEYYCPNCGYYLTSEYEGEYSTRCDKCGQVIDWSDEE